MCLRKLPWRRPGVLSFWSIIFICGPSPAVILSLSLFRVSREHAMGTAGLCIAQPLVYARRLFIAERGRFGFPALRRITEVSHMDVAAFLDRVQHHPSYAGQLAHVEMLPERPGKYDAPVAPLPPALASMLGGRGIERLYSHQVAALEHARAGRDFVVVTGTASGKTLCYHLPILEACLADPEARACICFPPRLVQDQLKNLLELLNGVEVQVRNSACDELSRGELGVRNGVRAKHKTASLFKEFGPETNDPGPLAAITAGVYDGDTPTAQRRRIQGRSESGALESRHAARLDPAVPSQVGRFFSELRFVVLDEVHTYRGILGAHVACVLRRLLRVCEHYGCAAGVPGHQRHDRQPRRAGQPSSSAATVEVIDDDGSPRGASISRSGIPTPLGNDRSPAAAPPTTR